jgi:hypothetical protein
MDDSESRRSLWTEELDRRPPLPPAVARTARLSSCLPILTNNAALDAPRQTSS